jgi:hypothetical protein
VDWSQETTDLSLPSCQPSRPGTNLQKLKSGQHGRNEILASSAPKVAYDFGGLSLEKNTEVVSAKFRALKGFSTPTATSKAKESCHLQSDDLQLMTARLTK